MSTPPSTTSATTDTTLAFSASVTTAWTPSSPTYDPLVVGPGTTWVFNYNGQPWPVMICPDELAPPEFMASRRNLSEIPAILLGRRKYLWILVDLLEIWDPHFDYLYGLTPHETDIVLDTDGDDVKLEKQRRSGFRQDATLYEKPEYWKNWIDTQRSERKIHRKLTIKHEGKHKRKRGDGSDGDDVARARSSEETLGPSKMLAASLATRDRLGPGRIATPARKLGRYSRSNGIASRAHDTELKAFESEADGDRRLRKAYNNALNERTPRDDECTVFVGTKQTPFLVPRDAVGKCDFLNNLVIFDEHRRSHLVIESKLHVASHAFEPIAEYLQRGENGASLRCAYGPPRLNGPFAQQELDAAAVSMAKFYLTASKLQMSALQTLAFEKLKALSPLTPPTLVVVARYLQLSGEWCNAPESLGWVVTHVTKCYWELVTECGADFSRLLRGHSAMSIAVFESMAKNAQAGLDDRVGA